MEGRGALFGRAELQMDGKQLLGSDRTRRVEPAKWKRLRNSNISVVKVQNFLSLKLISFAL